jgi:hypothetical protein
VDEETFDRVYGGAVKNMSSLEENEEHKSRTEKNKADTKLKEQQLALQQKQQETNSLIAIGGLTLGSVLVIILAVYLFAKLRKTKRAKQL